MKWYHGVLVAVLFYVGDMALTHAGVTDQDVKKVAADLACLCGDCPRRPLDECACGWADRYRQRIADSLDAGQDKQAIISGFVQEFGLEALSAPPAEGFHITAWIMPFLALVIGGLAVRSVIVNWRRNRLTATHGSPAHKLEPTDSLEKSAFRAQLERELKERNS